MTIIPQFNATPTSRGYRLQTIYSDQERAILAVLKGSPFIRSREVQDLLKVKEARARRILKGMVDKGILERRGRGRNTSYVRMC